MAIPNGVQRCQVISPEVTFSRTRNLIFLSSPAFRHTFGLFRRNAIILRGIKLRTRRRVKGALQE